MMLLQQTFSMRNHTGLPMKKEFIVFIMNEDYGYFKSTLIERKLYKSFSLSAALDLAQAEAIKMNKDNPVLKADSVVCDGQYRKV